jgi:hypothetical protein
MLTVKILGSGCANCRKLEAGITLVAMARDDGFEIFTMRSRASSSSPREIAVAAERLLTMRPWACWWTCTCVRDQGLCNHSRVK